MFADNPSGSIDARGANLCITVKLVFFACPLFRDLDDFAKITGREYSKSHAIFSAVLSSASINATVI